MGFRECVKSRNSGTMKDKSKAPLVIIFDDSINLNYVSCLVLFQDFKLVCFVYKYDSYHRLLAVRTAIFRFYKSSSPI